MPSFHSATFRLLGIEPQNSLAAISDVERAEQRLGLRLPSSVREWYCNAEAIAILGRYSNKDWPIPLCDFVLQDWQGHRLLPFKYENQGVCVWAIMLDGSDNPPVVVEVVSNGAHWDLQAPNFAAHIFACVWDCAFVLDQPALVQAQNEPLSSETVGALCEHFQERPPTFGWPGNTQHRFEGEGNAILIWSAEDQADWFFGARNAVSLEIALRTIWNLDAVGRSLYDCSEIGKLVLRRIRTGM